jgi:hypothetical protein
MAATPQRERRKRSGRIVLIRDGELVSRRSMRGSEAGPSASDRPESSRPRGEVSASGRTPG